MIYACVRAWRECPNLFLWNVGAWGILAIFSSEFIASLLRPPLDISFGRGGRFRSGGGVFPPPPSFATLLWDTATGEAFHSAQAGFAICGFILMLFAVARSVYRRLVVASTDSEP